MAGDMEKMNHSSMDRMDKAFADAGKQMEETIKAMEAIQQMIENGALWGLGGDAFQDAMKSKLAPRLKLIDGKMKELHNDINKAQKENREAEEKSRKLFG